MLHSYLRTTLRRSFVADAKNVAADAAATVLVVKCFMHSISHDVTFFRRLFMHPTSEQLFVSLVLQTTCFTSAETSTLHDT